jgi:hypothetical protein
MPRTVGTRKKTPATNETEAGKRFPLNMRTTKGIRDRLESAARANGRSLAQEVEHRLEQSFFGEDARAHFFGGADLDALCQQIAGAVGFVQQKTGKRWLEDYETYLAVSDALEGILKWVRQTMQPKPSSKSVTIVQEAIRAEPSWGEVPWRAPWLPSVQLPRAPSVQLRRAPSVQTPRFPSVQDARQASEEWAQFDREFEQYKQQVARAQEYFAQFKVIGEEAAASVIPNKRPSKV